MTEKSVSPRPYQDSKDLIYFENLLNEIATRYKTDKRDASDMLLSNYRISKSDPLVKGLLRCYKFTSKDGFNTDEFFQEQCIEFLSRIADGYEYSENPIPGHEGYYNVRKGNNFTYPDDADVWYGNYPPFLFRRSEVVNFFPALEIDVSDDTDDEVLVDTECVSEDWHGKETAWKMIAGLVIALGEVDEKCRTKSGDKVVKAKIYNKVVNLLALHEGITIQPDTLKRLLDNVLERYAPKFLEKMGTSRK